MVDRPCFVSVHKEDAVSTNYAKHFNPKMTPQSEAIPGREAEMKANTAGGVVFALDPWSYLDRFLILGAEGGTYYATEHEHTVEGAKNTLACIREDGPRVVGRIVEISTAGRAPKNSPALFALSLTLRYGDTATKRAAGLAIPLVARIGTHLFELVDYLRSGGGFNRRLQTALSTWYKGKEPVDLSYQLVKYQQRHGWSHRDVLRMIKPRGHARNGALHDLLEYATHGYTKDPSTTPEDHLRLPWAFELAKHSESTAETADLIARFDLPRECVQTSHLNDRRVWEALLYSGGRQGMPMTALVRNLAKMTSVGLIAPMSDAAVHVAGQLTDPDALYAARIHPLALLVALATYRKGEGIKGNLRWTPVSQIVDALDAAFHLAFDSIQPTGKRWLLALDVSGSMTTETVAGMPITPREASAAMAMVTARVEPTHHIVGFTSNYKGSPISPDHWAAPRGQHRHVWGSNDGLCPMALSPRQRLDDVLRTIKNTPAGGTDCAIPMLYAMDREIPVDVFVIYTDNETWAGKIHPKQALDQYRQKMGRDARCIVVGMTATKFTIADPTDKGMLDVVGFDTAAPNLMADFARGTF